MIPKGLLTALATIGVLVLAALCLRMTFPENGTEHWWFAWYAIGIAYLAYVALSGRVNPLYLALGADNRYSISKLQFLLWTGAIGFAACAVLAKGGFVVEVLEKTWHPELFIALGFSSLTLISAKAVTMTRVQEATIAKPPGTPAFAQFLLDDQGNPDLSKFQLLFWTIVAITAFLGQLRKDDAVGIPGISDFFLVLMGLADGTYLGKKLVTTDTPRLMTVSPVEALAGTAVKVRGAALGGVQAGSQILAGGQILAVAATAWGAEEVEFIIPADRLGAVDLQLVVNGRVTNGVAVTVVDLRVDGVSPSSVKTGDRVTLTGTGFGDSKTGLVVDIGGTRIQPDTVTPRTAAFVMPAMAPGTHKLSVERASRRSPAVDVLKT